MGSGDIIFFAGFTLMLIVASYAWIVFNRTRLSRKHLIKQLDNYSSIIDQANDALFVVDIADGRIHQHNPSAEQLLGYTTLELSKKFIFNLQPADMLEKSSRVIADVWEKGGAIYKDIPLVAKSGELIPVECSARVTPFAGRPAIVIYARDIRERLRLEAKLNEQLKVIDEKNKDINDSLEYSKRIQQSVFVPEHLLETYVPESFILFEPRDAVSGDFYWFKNYVFESEYTSLAGPVYKPGDAILLLAAVDCTGHGVPGAFMSLIGNIILNEAASHSHIQSVSQLLDHMNSELKRHLNNASQQYALKDGMDLAVCAIDLQNYRMEYAGAKNPVYLVRNGELHVLNTDKFTLSVDREAPEKLFTNHAITLQKGDQIYLFTDGYADQFGGDSAADLKKGGKKYLYRRFKETILSNSKLPMKEQLVQIRSVFRKWKGQLPQVDDVLVIGIRIP